MDRGSNKEVRQDDYCVPGLFYDRRTHTYYAIQYNKGDKLIFSIGPDIEHFIFNYHTVRFPYSILSNSFKTKY
jgi:hypothetical protein